MKWPDEEHFVEKHRYWLILGIITVGSAVGAPIALLSEKPILDVSNHGTGVIIFVWSIAVSMVSFVRDLRRLRISYSKEPSDAHRVQATDELRIDAIDVLLKTLGIVAALSTSLYASSALNEGVRRREFILNTQSLIRNFEQPTILFHATGQEVEVVAASSSVTNIYGIGGEELNDKTYTELKNIVQSRATNYDQWSREQDQRQEQARRGQALGRAEIPLCIRTAGETEQCYRATPHLHKVGGESYYMTEYRSVMTPIPSQ